MGDVCAAWIAVSDICGSGNNSPACSAIHLSYTGNGGKKYQDLLMNIKKHHCHENTTAKLKSSNPTCLFQPHRSVYKVMWSNELGLREYVKAI